MLDHQTVIVNLIHSICHRLRVSVRGKLIPKTKYNSQQEFREEYGKAQREEFQFNLRRE